MADSDENTRGLSSSSIIGYLLNDPVNELKSQIQTMCTREPRSIGFLSNFLETNMEFSPLVETIGSQDYVDLDDESSDFTSQPQESSPPLFDISSTLQSVASTGTLGLKEMYSSVLKLLADNPAFTPSDDQDNNADGAAQPVEEEGLSFCSNYFAPLYQDYSLQAVREDLLRLSNKFVSEPTIPKYAPPLPFLRPPRSPPCHSKAPQIPSPDVTPPYPPPYPPNVVPQIRFWHDLDEVKAHGGAHYGRAQGYGHGRAHGRAHGGAYGGAYGVSNREIHRQKFALAGYEESNYESPGGTPYSPLLPPTVVPQSRFWHDLEEVKASGLLLRLSKKEIDHQESMFELMTSEASYFKSLGVAVDHFYASESLKQTLSPMEHRILFSNIVHVRTASEKFLKDLGMRLAESVLISQVGDNVLRHCSEFRRRYVPYVTNMQFQEEALKDQQQKRDFLSTVKLLESDPVCERQSLWSFLVLPFQRITRLKMLLERILKATEQGSHSILNLEKAIDTIHEIVTECNEGVEKCKRMRELVGLDAKLDFSRVKSFPLVVHGRFLVHDGTLRQLEVDGARGSKISFTRVHLHLFNNLLIVSSKSGHSGSFSVVDHAVFPEHVRIVHVLNESLRLPPDSFLLHLTQSGTGQPTAMLLVADKSSDKEGWMKALNGGVV